MGITEQIKDIELASRRAWPALEESESSLALLRYARGVSRRANSLTPLSPQADAMAGLMQLAERYYWGRGLPAIIRVASFMTAAQSMQSALAAAGYQPEAPTAVMIRPLEKQPVVNGCRALLSLGSRQWLAASAVTNPERLEDQDLRQSLLDRIADPVNYLAFEQAGGFVATAMAVRSGEALGLFGIATAPAWQRQGLAGSLILQQLAWGQMQGARYAYLQVEESNLAAIRLYRKLGFTELYSYCYYVKVAGNKSGLQVIKPELRP